MSCKDKTHGYRQNEGLEQSQPIRKCNPKKGLGLVQLAQNNLEQERYNLNLANNADFLLQNVCDLLNSDEIFDLFPGSIHSDLYITR